ncbi:MAG: PBP1A family penicillin-binding protein [Patescibacteria group bacterium]
MPIPQLRSHQNDSWRGDVKHGNSRKINKKSLKKKLFLSALTLLGIFIIVGLATVAWLSRDLPNPNQLINRQIAQSTKIYDRTGENVLYEISGDERRTLVPLKDIPNYVKEATVSIEDKNFYKHGAFSIWAMARTAVTNVIYRRSAGGSTLTQQFIKNAVLSNEKTFTRKIKELILAYQLEKKFSKDDILQMYLNEIPYGSNAYGVEAASEKYFGKSVRDVSLPEAAILAALPQSPSRYSPYGDNKDILLSRKDYVLDLMAEQGYISAEERDNAKKQEIVFKPRDNNITAPHFVMYIKEMLAEKYGEKMVEQEGLKIYTTLDLYKQKIAEQIITEKTKDYPTKYGANNAALVSIDPKTGQILAMVGSRDYFDDSIDGQVNVATRPRQPGSSMKPIVYAALFEKGYTPNTILYDVVTNFSTDPANPYTPHDYDLKERGPVTIRQALAGSLNVPAVKAIYLAGINNVIDLAESLGYTTLFPRSRFGLSLVLGGGEVELLEHTNAYSAFARDGIVSPVVSILKVEDKNGNVLEEYKPAETKALDSQVARMINSVLSDNAARTYIFGAKNNLNLGSRPVGAKTGTTNDYHDAWTIGYTPSLVTGVWVGNSDNAAMKGAADGSVVAAPIWHDYMAAVLGDTPVENFKAPDDYTTGKAILDGQVPTQTVNIDQSSGLLATSSTPPEFIVTESATINHSILYYVDKDNPRGPIPSDPSKDPQFNLWESAVQAWSLKNSSSTALTLPTNYDATHKPENKPSVNIVSPTNNQTISDNFLNVKIEATAPRGIGHVDYFINNNLWQTQTGATNNVSAPISFLTNGYQSLRVHVCDDIENCTDATINFNLLINNNPVAATNNSIALISPNSGLALNSIDFPLPITFNLSHPESVASVSLIAKDAAGKLSAIGSARPPFSNSLTLPWTKVTSTGSYSVYGELHDWNGDIIPSNVVGVTIK